MEYSTVLKIISIFLQTDMIINKLFYISFEKMLSYINRRAT